MTVWDRPGAALKPETARMLISAWGGVHSARVLLREGDPAAARRAYAVSRREPEVTLEPSQPVVLVDAFADAPFTGNPAGVCVLAGPCDGTWMQAVAAELNLPATAFLWRELDRFALRWFTPLGELALCGHGTLAAAHVLWEETHL